MTDREKIIESMTIITNYSYVDGAHHKQWCLDQITRILLGDKYHIYAAQNKIDEGIAP